jgi:hypothetical protein
MVHEYADPIADQACGLPGRRKRNMRHGQRVSTSLAGSAKANFGYAITR